jgi:hypothetical protein
LLHIYPPLVLQQATDHSQRFWSKTPDTLESVKLWNEVV